MANKETILIVDDDEQILRFLKLQLTHNEYDVLSATNGEDALKILQNKKDIPLILLDIMLPGIDGVSLCSNIKSINPKIKIIMVSAKNTSKDVINSLDSGADDYVKKPFVFDELLARIRANLRKTNNQENSNLIGTSVVLDGGDMVGVRDYVVGDNIKNIHWKLSSKSDGLIMKSFAEDIFDQAYIIADMSAYHTDEYISSSLTDCVVEATLSIIRDYQKNGIRFSLIVNTSKSEVSRFSISTPADLLEAEMYLSMSPMVRDTNVIDLLRSVDNNVLSGCEVSIITSNLSEEMYKSVKKQFVDKNSDLKIVNIALEESTVDSRVITFTKDYIEKQEKRA